MDLIQNVGDLAIEAVEEFENVLFLAATAESNGFKSIWSMYGKLFVVAAASGATVGSLAFLEEVVTGSKKGHSDDVLIGLLGGGLAAYGTSLFYREKMYKDFTGSGFIHIPVIALVGCVGVPAVVNSITAKTGNHKKAFKNGIAFGTLFYVLIGIIPVIVLESRKKSAALKTMKDLFDKCYPYNAATPCSEKHAGFVQKFDSMVPNFIARAINIKDNKEGMLTVMDRLMVMQNLDILRALAKTPLARLFGAAWRTSHSQSPMLKIN